MAFPFSDTFTTGANTTLEAYSVDWDAVAENTAINVVAANDWCVGTAPGFRYGVCNANTGVVTEYYCEVTGATIGATNSDGFGAAVRHDGSAKAAADAYSAMVYGDGSYIVRKYVNGVGTDLASGAITAVSFSAATEYTLKFQIDDAGAWAFTIDGISQASGSGETSIPAAGNPGFYLIGTSAEITSISADSLAAGSGDGFQFLNDLWW